MKHLVVGFGEIGKGIYNVLTEKYEVSKRDIQDNVTGVFDVLHVCYPNHNSFVETTKNYILQYNPSLVIIHSTVPVGTTKKCGEKCVHSPVRGRHPYLAEGIKTFVKFIGANTDEQAEEVEKIFTAIKIKTYRCKNSDATELMKILSTTRYGWEIIFAKEVDRLCKEYNVPFNQVYTMSNKTYNEGYTALGDANFHRSLLKAMPGEIGGHCVVQNCELLNDFVTKFIKENNQRYGE